MTPSHSLCFVVADDDPIARKMAQHELEAAGHKVGAFAANGHEALAMSVALEPDVVLMDIAMPGLDGIEATRLIQERSPRPVVLLSSYDDSKLVRQASEAGAGAYLVKPLSRASLDRAITIAVARHADLMELRRLNAELQKALAEVKTLRGIIPICFCCKKIQTSDGYWLRVEAYLEAHSEARFTHGLCGECSQSYGAGIKETGPAVPAEPQT